MAGGGGVGGWGQAMFPAKLTLTPAAALERLRGGRL